MMLWPAAGVGSYEMENIMSSGQGKFPLEVVTDNALLRSKYENDELGGKFPLYVTTTSAQEVEYSVGTPAASRFGPTPFGGVPVLKGSCSMPDSSYNTVVSGMSIKRFGVLRDANTVRLVYINWYNSASNPGAQIAVNAAVQRDDPGAPKVQVTFGGDKYAAIEPLGFAVSDPVNCNVTKGNSAYVLTHIAGAVVAYKAQNPAVPAWLEAGSFTAGTAAVDVTTVGGLTANTSPTYSPLCVVSGEGVGKPYVGINGDSNNSGTGDANGTSVWGKGWLDRLFADSIPTLNISIDGRQVGAVQMYNRRMFYGCTDIIVPLGINDLSASVGNQTAAVLQTRLIAEWLALKNLYPITHMWQSDYMPNTSSTDAWATVENQSVLSSEAQRLAANAWINDGCPIDSSNWTAAAVGAAGATIIRAGRRINGVFTEGDVAHPVYGCISITEPITSVKANGDQVWTPGTVYVTDNLGIHMNAAGHQACADAAAWIIPLLQVR